MIVTAPAAHSKYSASGYEAATLCPGKRVMEKGKPDSSSKYADEGTAAHTLLGWCIDNGKPALAYLGRRIPVGISTWEVTREMAEAVQTAVDNIAEIAADGMVLSEQRVNYSRYLNVPKDEAWGTSDILAACDSELQVHDYKHGMGVEVDAEQNPQMMLYGLGALEAVNDSLGPFETVRLVIHQPRIKEAPSEWVTTVAELERWGHGEALRAAEEQRGAEHMRTSLAMTQAEWERVYLRPNAKSCKFCRAKATCPALRNEAAKTVFEVTPAAPDEFDDLRMAETPKQSDLDWLEAVHAKSDLIVDYLKSVAAEIERRLFAGEQGTKFKLVQGKRGDRKWTDPAEAEKALAAAGDAAYEPRKLISPTKAEELAPKKPKTRGPDKGKAPPPSVISAEHWTALQSLITQADGKAHVAPVSDPRPALAVTPASDDFDTVTADSSNNDFA